MKQTNQIEKGILLARIELRKFKATRISLKKVREIKSREFKAERK